MHDQAEGGRDSGAASIKTKAAASRTLRWEVARRL